MKPKFSDYVREAFGARPLGMFFPPNWVGLGVFALLGILNPGFWLLGLGLELAYLGTLSNNKRFQRLVNATFEWKTRRQWQARVDELVLQLSPDGQRRYRALEVRCRSILEQQLKTGAAPAPGLDEQSQGLGRLLWIYLRLLLTRQAIEKIVRESGEAQEDTERLQQRAGELQQRIKDEKLGEELRRSLTGQLDILQQRLQKRHEARDKLDFLDAELTRIQEQAELVREQAVLSTDPDAVSQRIDQITTTLGGTTEWIKEQQQIYGAVEDLLAEPPSLSVNVPLKQEQ
jgi:hypothetical protein